MIAASIAAEKPGNGARTGPTVKNAVRETNMRTKEWRLQNLKRVIGKRLQILKQWRFNNEVHPWEMEPHRAHKFNLNCGCKMCHYYKHVGNSKQKFTIKDRRAHEIFLQEKELLSEDQGSGAEVPLSETKL